MSEQQQILIEVQKKIRENNTKLKTAHQDAVLSCLLYTSPSPRDRS